jgi:WD40 repeat protein
MIDRRLHPPHTGSSTSREVRLLLAAAVLGSTHWPTPGFSAELAALSAAGTWPDTVECAHLDRSLGLTIVGVIRALVVGAAEFDAAGTAGEWDPRSVAGFSPLPAVLPAVRALARSLSRFDDIELVSGSPIVNPDLGTLNGLWQALRKRGGEATIVFFTGHGVARGKSLYLPVLGTDPARLPDTAIPVARWLDEVEDTDNAVPTLFVFDVCQAGTAALYQAMQETFGRDRKTWVIAACAPDESAFGARFTSAFAEVLDELRAGGLNTWPRTEHVPLSTIAQKVDQKMVRLSGADALPQTVFRTPEYATGQGQPFFPDPGFTEDRYVRMRQLMDAGLREMTDAVLARAPDLDPIHFFTRVSGTPPGKPYAGSCFFTGRTSELRTMAEWMREGPPLLTVTGSPGTGKSALLGVLTCLCHPQMRELSVAVRSRVPFEVRPTAGSACFAAVHARFRDPSELVASLAAQLGFDRDGGGWTVSKLAGQLAALAEPAVLVIDAVDEALGSRRLVQEVILPLLDARTESGRPVCRMAIGVRPWWDHLPGLRQAVARGRLIDLDSSTSAPQLAVELAVYIDDLLGAVPGYDRTIAEAVGTRLAEADGRFLLASLFVDYLARNPPLTLARAVELLPPDLPGMFRLQLDASSNPRLGVVLSVVAQAKGQGMPLELIHRCVQSGVASTTLNDVRDALAEAGFYLRVVDDPEDGPLYRFYHQSLVDYFLPAADSQALLTGLLTSVSTDGKTRAWWDAPAYLLRHVLDHAVDAGSPAVDGLILDAGLLVYAEPRSVVRSLDAAISTYAQRQASIYAASCRMTIGMPPEQRKHALALDAVRQGRQDLAQAFWDVPTGVENPPLRFRWATGPERLPNLLISIGPATVEHVSALAVGHSDDTPVVLVGGVCGVVDVHETVHGSLLFSLRGHDEPIVAIDTVELDDITLAVTGSSSKVCAWNLADGSPYSEYADAGLGLAALQVGEDDDDHSVIAYLATKLGTLQYVDLDTGQHLHTLTGVGPDVRALQLRTQETEQYAHFVYASEFAAEAEMTAVALGTVNGKNLEIVGDRRGYVRVWESGGSGKLLHSLTSYDRGYVMKGDRWPTEWGGDQTIRHVRERKGGITAVALGHVRGLPVAVAAQDEEYVRIWDIGYRSIVNPAGVAMRETLYLARMDGQDVLVVDVSAFDRPTFNRQKMQLERIHHDPHSVVWARADGALIEADDKQLADLVASADVKGATVRTRQHDHSSERDDLDFTTPVTTRHGKPVQVASDERGRVYVRDAVSGEPVGGPLYLPSFYPRPALVVADEDGIAAYWAHEVAVLEWVDGAASENCVPSPEITHVVAWFPGALLSDVPDSELWDVHSMADWVAGEPLPQCTIGAPIDVDPKVLKRLVAQFLDKFDLDVIAMERSTYGVRLAADDQEHEFPLFFVTTLPRPDPR